MGRALSADSSSRRSASASRTNLHRLRRLLQRFGVDVRRYPTQEAGFATFLSSCPRTVLDVGANDGGFARDLRTHGYTGSIISFEPARVPFASLANNASRDADWSAYRLALADRNGEATLNIAANGGASSSLLPMLPRHENAAPHARFVSTETVPIMRLDDWVQALDQPLQKPALKIDAQGFESAVLEGAEQLLTTLVAMQIELSLVPLYAQSWLWNDAVGWLSERGFRLAAVIPGFTDQGTGRQLQFDGVFLPGE